MKKLLLALTTMLLIASTTTAQITISNQYFPAAGDTLRTAADNLPSGIEIGSTGGPQTWDYTGLQAPASTNTVFAAATEGQFASSFPAAELFTAGPAGAENYYSVSSTQFELLGNYGDLPIDLGFEAVARFLPPLLERWAPLSFGASQASNAKLRFPFSPDDLPVNIFEGLPIAPDSLALSLETDRTDFVDAYGTMNLPGGSFDVLRIKRQDVLTSSLEAKLSFGNWFDVSNFIPENPLIGEFAQTTYIFYANGVKEPIATVFTDTANSDVVTRVEFKSMDPIINRTISPSSQPAVFVYPNPAIEEVRFDFQNLPSGEYTLHIYNILGVSVWQKNYTIDGNKTVKASLSNLRKGTYLYSLINSDGRTLTTKRLMILRP